MVGLGTLILCGKRPCECELCFKICDPQNHFFPFKALLLYGDFVGVPNFETHATDIVSSIELLFTAEKVIS